MDEKTKDSDYLSRATVLVEALPYIQKYNGKTVVVKYGGNAMISEELRSAVISDIILLHLVGIRVIMVHGGGPEIGHMLKRVGKESEFVDGLRYTDAETMEIVQQVLCGKINKDLVATINRAGAKAVGLCGMDGMLLQAKKLDDKYGLVGEITHVCPNVVNDCLHDGYIPVISTVAQGMDANTAYNINADTAAAKIAIAVGAEKLILLTDVRGVLRDPKDPTTLINQIHLDMAPDLIEQGIITGGMIPKIECCMTAVQNGVRRTHILDGRIPHAILTELLSHRGVGTMILE
ncbi:MAG: acetylglutamate kinase [Evtepia sp.]